jgi:hypothetical protein
LDTVPDAESLWVAPTLDDLGLAIVCTVAYADVFDYPLTVQQVHRYLVAVTADRDEVLKALDDDAWTREGLERHGAYLTLRRRGALVELRERRAAIAARMWPSAARYARAIAALPFVRALALTGALAVGNVDAGDDFDFLIITAASRLWLTRAMIIGFVVRPAARRGHEICPNYLLSERKLDFQQRNLYAAHELAQMVPLVGHDIYRRMRRMNRWTNRFLPNAGGLPRSVGSPVASSSSARSLAEAALGSFVGAGLERFERQRKIRRFSAEGRNDGTACFSPDRCKGHFESNEQAILEAFDRRLGAIVSLGPGGARVRTKDGSQ